MQPQHAWFVPGLEVTADGVPDRLAQGVDGVSLREYGGSQRSSGESAFGGLFDQEHQLVHSEIIARGGLAGRLGCISPRVEAVG